MMLRYLWHQPSIVAVTMSQHWMLGCLQETSWFQGIFFSGSFPKKPLFWPSNPHTKATISIQIFLCGINPPYIIPIRFPLDCHFESFNIPIIYISSHYIDHYLLLVLINKPFSCTNIGVSSTPQCDRSTPSMGRPLVRPREILGRCGTPVSGGKSLRKTCRFNQQTYYMKFKGIYPLVI